MSVISNVANLMW